MSKRPLSQEGLKFLACAIMLLDHIGATLIPWGTLRIIGRLAFPIFCFLLAEGAHYTRNPRNYLLRLGIGAILSELPFDLALFGSWSWQHQSVMITLLLGTMALLAMKRMTQPLLKILVLLLFAFLADFMNTDYGGAGVLMIALFGLTRERKYGWLVQLLNTRSSVQMDHSWGSRMVHWSVCFHRNFRNFGPHSHLAVFREKIHLLQGGSVGILSVLSRTSLDSVPDLNTTGIKSPPGNPGGNSFTH